MISFFVCLVVLIVGFFTYGKIAEKVFGSDDRTPPSLAMTDGADYVPMSTPKRISLDHIGHHFCRRSPRFYDRHDVYAA